MGNWELSISGESDFWDRYSSEISTVIHQEQYIENLDIYKDYCGKYGKSNLDLDFKNKNVIDVGGGPCSILLRANGGKRREEKSNQHSWGVNSNTSKTLNIGVVIDPVIANEYVKLRYEYFNIKFINDIAENVDSYYNENNFFDEAIIYNCLQHVQNPLEILDKITKISKKIRICEPLNIPTDELHLHMFDFNFFKQYFNDKNFIKIKEQNCFIGVEHFLGIYEKK